MVLARRLRKAGVKRLVNSLKPVRIDMLLFEVQLDSYQVQIPARVQLEIQKSASADRLIYRALVNSDEVHRSHLYDYALLPVQFGYGKYPVIGDCVTKPECRGFRIYPHVLGHILRDLQATSKTEKVYILVAPDNHPSIRGIEHAGFQYVARLTGVRIGPFVLNRSGSHQK